MHVYNPDSFDPFEILPKSLWKFADDARYFVHKVYIEKTLRKNKDGFVPLKAAYLCNIISQRKYTQIRESLIKSKTITTDGYWICGTKSIGYAIGKKFKNDKHQKIEITSKRLIKKLTSLSESSSKKIKSKEHEHLFCYLKQLEIDQDDIDLSVAMFKNKDWYFIADNYGRVHTNLTNLRSSMRSYVKWNDQSLLNIDICNSQPLFLGMILKRDQEGIFKGEHPVPSYTILRSNILPKDVIDYIDLVEAGEIYEYLADHAGIEIEDRTAFKKKVFAEIFFCRNETQTQSSELFKKLFPNVYYFVRQVKKDDYTNLAKLLQRTESQFVINTVIRRCMQDCPQMPVFTIHDSIMTTEPHVDALQGIMLEEFGKLGMTPKIRIENCR